MNNQREIKFRVWDILGKKMHYPSLIAISTAGACRIDYDTNFLPGDSIIQQFTGLKDKNGKEIYEGDLIKIQEYDDEKDEYSQIAQIKYGNGTFDGGYYSYVGFYLENKAGETLEPNEITSLVNDDSSNNFYVVGNIFENPNLLV